VSAVNAPFVAYTLLLLYVCGLADCSVAPIKYNLDALFVEPVVFFVSVLVGVTQVPSSLKNLTAVAV
jgi:hypothetical protein